MEVFIGAIIGIAIGAVISGTLIWIVGKLGIGLTVKSFGWAMLAGLLIGIISTLVSSLIPESQGLVGALVNLLVSAAVIFAAGKLLTSARASPYDCGSYPETGRNLNPCLCQRTTVSDLKIAKV